MRYWDTSGVVPLTITEDLTDAMLDALREDPAMVTWWGTAVEVMSAIARRQREGQLDAAGADEAIGRVRGYRGAWTEIEPSERLRETSIRLVRTHPLRAADALQLAAAIAASGDRPADLPFVTLDARLALAASKEGFPVVRPVAT